MTKPINLEDYTNSHLNNVDIDEVDSCTDIVNPNFTSLAESFGFLGLRVGTTDEFYVAFESALNSERGAVLDLNVSSESLVPRQSLSDIRKNALNNQSK